jgi:copper chaperone CopZ
MKKLFIIAFLVGVHAAQSQVTKVSLQASGLTCSMCSNAINKSLKAIGFVDRVDANIKNSSFEIYFKPSAVVDFDKLKKAVEDAGFFVVDFRAMIHFDKINAENDHHLQFDNRVFHFIGINNQLLDGDREIRFLDKGFVSIKEFKKNSNFTKMACYKTGVAGDCCKKDGLATGTRIFHVSI